MIYFIQEKKTKNIKIGFTSRNVEERIDTLQVGNSNDLILLAVFDGCMKTERQLHRIFKPLKERGEWFRTHIVLADFILSARLNDSLPTLEILSKIRNV